ncbi:UPF0272 protein [Capsulimonas corticalis]|uniref:Putative nickel insertion protein n=1 Tax=Capsulimonas corticalis TaxID=2219043 RepID=A0A402D5F6_9BACT|nr:nickel pincer cofactor biosynthesis protein LarC [Capsulimonas corticalis]BDI29760.1 UPF0272 protein [Capsulimonas corticalis]
MKDLDGAAFISTDFSAITDVHGPLQTGINKHTMKIAYFDCFSGVSGDMTLGALLACDGADETQFRRRLAALNLPGYELSIQRVTREGISATDVDVRLIERDQGHGRHLADIAAILENSGLSSWVRTTALTVFTRLADAEAKIHGATRDAIHFHEVGAVDAIVDIAGSCILLEMLGVDRIASSSIPCGYGTITCQHGIMPVPAPATMELLKGFPVHSVDIRGELVTPTGAALITTLADPKTAGRLPAMRVLTNGFGAGKKQFKPDMPNLLRIVIGETDDAPSSHDASSGDATPQTVAVLEANLDDQSPEAFDLLMERCFAAGALDVFFTPIQMKKNRPATLLTVLCPADLSETLAAVIFRESSTFGVRHRTQERYTLARTWRTANTPYGEIRLKVGAWRGETMTIAPEYEDCRRAALAHGVPLAQVYRAALIGDKDLIGGEDS